MSTSPLKDGTLVEFGDNWKKRDRLYGEKKAHDNHIHVVIGHTLHNDGTYAYKLMCTEDGYMNSDTHQSWLEEVKFKDDLY